MSQMIQLLAEKIDTEQNQYDSITADYPQQKADFHAGKHYKGSNSTHLFSAARPLFIFSSIFHIFLEHNLKKRKEKHHTF